MATRVGDEIVKSPRELVISAYATMPDITKVVTPDIKNPGESQLIFIEIAGPKARLGGFGFGAGLRTDRKRIS